MHLTPADGLSDNGVNHCQRNGPAPDLRLAETLRPTLRHPASLRTCPLIECLGCTVSGNGDHGVIIRRNSAARLVGNGVSGATVTGNVGGGILLSEESSIYFGVGGIVTGNPGGLDVSCAVSGTSAKFVTFNINGGTTNCVEPVDP